MLTPSPDQLDAIQAGTNSSIKARFIRAVLRCAVPFYRLGLHLDQARKSRRAAALARPTVSIGNLTAGGTGKTPFTVELVRRLRHLGHRPAVLMRGYAPGKHETPGKTRTIDTPALPDETELLRAALGDAVPVEPNPSRRAGAAAVLDRDPGVTCFVLDDGFQHRQVKRDLDLVLIDATAPFGHGHLLPRGLLREPLPALARADAVILTRADQVDDAERNRIVEAIARHHGRPPLAHAAARWAALLDHDGNEYPVVDHLKNLRVHAVSAIGNPRAFRHQLEQQAQRVAGHTVFPDHHAYRPTDVEAVLTAAQREEAEALVLTEKDWLKWQRAAAGLKPTQSPTLPVLRPVLNVVLFEGSDALDALLNDRLPANEP